MKHLTEEELIERYFGEGNSDAAQHLAACRDCVGAYEKLQADIASFDPLPSPVRDAHYGEQVWSAISPLLPSYPQRKRAGWERGFWLALGSAAACAVLVAAAFYAGRTWEHHQPHAPVAKTSPTVRERVVVVLLSDQLDRSERLLVELKHANPDDSQIIPPIRDEARDLLASNNDWRKKAEKSGDPDLTQALDHLNGLLIQLANQPGGLNPAAISRLQQQMKADGLLFEVRVLRSRIPNKQASAAHLKGGTV